MFKIWPIFGNIVLLMLIVGGLSYILTQFVGREDDPAPPILAEVKEDAEAVAAKAVVLEEASRSSPVQVQTMAIEPTRVITATSSLSSTQMYLKLKSLTRFDSNTYRCSPDFAPSGGDFLCYLRDKDESQLWLASLEEGLKQPLVTNQRRLAFAWLDKQHILYSPRGKSPSPPSEPLFLMNIDNGTSIEIGQMSPAWTLEVLSANRVAFLNQQEAHIASLGLNLRAVSQMTSVTIKDKEPPSTEDCPTEPEHAALACQSAMAQYRHYHHTYAKVSPDAQNVAVLETGIDNNLIRKGTLTIIDVQSQEKTVLVKDIAARERDSFAWSPDGTRLVYTLISTETHKPELWMAQRTDLDASQFLWTSEWAGGPASTDTFDYVTWLPDREDELMFIHVSGDVFGPHSVYQVINLKTREVRELFRNGTTLSLSLDREGGYRIVFFREVVNNKLDPGNWIATLSY